MSFYISQFVSYFLLPAFLSGLIYSSFKSFSYKQQFGISFIAIIAGSTLFLSIPWQQKWVLMLTTLALLTYISIFLYGIWLFFTPNNKILPIFGLVLVSLVCYRVLVLLIQI